MFYTVIFYSDPHGHKVSTDAVNELQKSIDTYKPHYIVCGGDILDVPSLRRGAGGEDLAEGFNEDAKAAIKLIKDIKPDYITFGNHDYRVEESAKNVTNGIVRDACVNIMRDIRNACNIVNTKTTNYSVHDNGVKLKIGGPLMLHGFRSSIISPAKALCENFSDAVAGHVHSPDMYIAPNVNKYKAYTVGLMANPVFEYNARQASTFKHKEGHGIIDIHESGEWWLYHVSKDKDVWFRP